jgi:hypothetical protein
MAIKPGHDNKKLPEVLSSVQDELDVRYIYTESDGINFKISHMNPEDYKKTSFDEFYDASGEYSSKGSYPEDDHRGLSISFKHHSRDFIQGGASQTVYGHNDKTVNATDKTSVAGDSGTDIIGNKFVAVKGQEITAVRESRVATTFGASEAPTYDIKNGDSTDTVKGDKNQTVEGDNVESNNGSKLVIVGDEYGVNVQGGNFDQHVNGKTAIYSESDLLIESATKITIKVGSSTIVITDSAIDIDATRIDLN